MNRICIALAALLPLLCEAAKLTHYADSSLFVKYPANLSTNAAPARLPRQLDEAAIPGGGPSSNRIKRITFDVACAMAGTVDAFVQRNVAASLFGTPEAEGFLLGTNYFTGAQYATTNVICSQLFFDNVMHWPNQDTWVGPDYYGQYKLYSRSDFGLYAIDYNMSYTNSGTGHTSVHVWTNAPTRRLFADKYLRPVEDMLSFDVPMSTANAWIPSVRALSGRTHAWDLLECWCHYPPSVRDESNTVGRVFYDEYGYYDNLLTFGWGSSFAESASYGTTSGWIDDPNDLVSYWGNFFPEIPKIFEDESVTMFDDSGFMYKTLKNTVEERSCVFVRMTDYEGGYEMLTELRGHLEGYLYSNNLMYNEPYTGRHGFDLMHDTCCNAYTNFPTVDTRRIVNTPFEFCNSFLGLVDTYYVGRDAMPMFVYDRKEEHASVENTWIVHLPGTMTLVFDSEKDRWIITNQVSVTADGFIQTTTNYLYDVQSVPEIKDVAFITPSSPANLALGSTNELWVLRHGYAEQNIRSIVGNNDLYDVEGSIWVSGYTGELPHSDDWIDMWIQIGSFDPTVVGTFFDSDPLPAMFVGSVSWDLDGIKITSERTEFDRTLMSSTNSMPCCHPIDIQGFDIGPDVIHFASFLGAYLETNSQIYTYKDFNYADIGKFKLYAEDTSNALGVDGLAESAEEELSQQLNSMCLSSCKSDENSGNLAHLLATWDIAGGGREITPLVSDLITNGFHRGFSCYASGIDEVHFKVDRAGTIWVRKCDPPGSSWVPFESEPDFLKIYLSFEIVSSAETEKYRRRESCYAKGSMTSIGAVKYDFKTMKREE